MAHVTPLGAVVRGLVGGAVGTLALDLVAFVQFKRGGGEGDFVAWELAKLDGWDDAPAPAQVGKRLYEGFTQRQLGSEWATTVNNLTHWGYGIAWGGLYGVLAGSASRPRVRGGLLLGPAVFASSYTTLPAAGLYKPIWQYDLPTLAQDLLRHVAYGLATSSAFRVLAGRRSADGG